ncbi:hypothetical protein TRICI_005788 [Trichomonascus ciferrii]|uniref:Uncharacterized protein n=1 Tax=Trichomonascus ciferrii TaxID=44093 RepID=A0A642UVY8_9ASCO|nr:hypothetical protein TRICI_005788 [Trichomonascus ciferrii]
MWIPLEVWKLVFYYSRVERFRQFKKLIALRSVGSAFYTLVRDYKPTQLSVSREGVKLEVNPELFYDDGDDFFSGESGKLTSYQNIKGGKLCTEWKRWLNFVKEIVVPEQKTESQTRRLLKAFLASFEQSELTLPKYIELEIKQPSDPESNEVHQLLKMIDSSTIPFVATVAVKEPSTEPKKQVVLGSKIRSLDAYFAVSRRDVLAPEPFKMALPADWNIIGGPNKWRNLVIIQVHDRLDSSTGIDLEKMTKHCERQGIEGDRRGSKGIYISDAQMARTHGISPYESRTDFFLNALGFLKLRFKKVVCTKKNRCTFQLSKDHGGHQITLTGCDIFPIFTALRKGKVAINELEIHMIWFDCRVGTYVAKMKNLQRIIIKIYNKSSPNMAGYLSKDDAEETLTV